MMEAMYGEDILIMLISFDCSRHSLQFERTANIVSKLVNVNTIDEKSVILSIV